MVAHFAMRRIPTAELLNQFPPLTVEVVHYDGGGRSECQFQLPVLFLTAAMLNAATSSPLLFRQIGVLVARGASGAEKHGWFELKPSFSLNKVGIALL